MRRKKLLRQVAAAAVALSMAVSLSAPAFAATFDLSNGGLVITAKDDGITVKQDGQKEATSIADNEEIVVTGTYKPAGGAALTAEENRQDENQPVTPAKAPAKEETPKETQEAEDAPAAEKKQEQKDAEAPADPEQKTETENKDKNNDPADEEKKEQNAPANGELNASAGERQESKAEDESQPKPEAKASAEASTSASDDASNGPRKASAYEDRMSGSWEEDSYTSGLRAGIVQIINNTAKKIKVSLSNAHIDLPGEAGTISRGQAAIDVQGSGEVELKFSGSNTLTGSGRSAGIQKNDKDPDGKDNTGKLTITADSESDTLDVKVDERALGQANQSAAIGGHGRKTYNEYGGYGTKNIVIEGNGTVNTNAKIGSGAQGGAATGIVIQGNAVVNVGGGGIGGSELPYWATEKPGTTDVTITGNAKVTVKDGTIGSGIGGESCGDAKINISGNAEVNVQGGGSAAVIGSGAGGDADVTITGTAKVTAVQKSDWYGGGAGIGGGANGKGRVTIGGKAQVKATGSAEYHDSWQNNGAGAAIGDGGTTGKKSTDTVQNGKNQFSTDKGIQDGAKVEMTNIGHNSSNTVTKTYKTDKWVTEGDEEQPPEECKHQKGSYSIYEETVSPNCTETGSKTYRCRSCGEITRVEKLDVNPNSHTYGETVTVPPTCTEKGYKVYKCGRCHQEYGGRFSFVDAPGHQFVETTVAPTCTESGYTVQKCSVCGEETGERTNIVAPLGHEYKNGVCIRCGAPEPQENGSAAPNYTVTGAETYETSVVDGRYIIAVPSEDAALNAVLGDLRAIKAQGADVVVFRTRSRESSLVIDEMLAMGTDVTPFVLAHNGGEAQLTINGAAHNELIH